MASIRIEGLPLAGPAEEPWPPNGMGDDHPIGIQADEMFARQLDTGFAARSATCCATSRQRSTGPSSIIG
jgi:hypothetical protein